MKTFTLKNFGKTQTSSNKTRIVLVPFRYFDEINKSSIVTFPNPVLHNNVLVSKFVYMRLF